MNYTHIIWDFNGTLLSDMEAGILSVNTMLTERGLSPIQSIEQYRDVFKFPIIEYYRDLGFDFNSEPYEVLAPIWIELYNQNSISSPLQDGAIAALEEFKACGIPQILLSATELNMLSGQVKALGISEYFEEIMGLDNIHAYSKKALALAWQEKNPSARPLFIGDTEHDAEVARAVDANCILIAGGHQSKATLKESGFPVFNTLSELLVNIKKSDFSH